MRSACFLGGVLCPVPKVPGSDDRHSCEGGRTPLAASQKPPHSALPHQEALPTPSSGYHLYAFRPVFQRERGRLKLRQN